jgi:FAD synthase
MSHRFRAGQKVVLAPSRFGSDRQGTFEVVRILPEEHGINQYRLKSMLDGRERVATEDELSKLG